MKIPIHEALKTEAGRLAINEAVAKLEGWKTFKDHHGFLRRISPKGHELERPNYLESSLAYDLPLPDCTIVIFKGWLIRIVTQDFGIHESETEREARVLAYLTWNGITEVEAEDDS